MITGKARPSAMTWLFPLLLSLLPAVLGTLALLYFGALRPDLIPGVWPVSLTGNAFVDGKLKYQFVAFAIGMAALALTYGLAPHNARRFYRPGNLKALAGAVKWLDIKPTDDWGKVGSSFAVIVSLATGAFIYFTIARGQSLESANVRFLPFVLVLAALNAFTEEAITRLSVVTALDGRVSRPLVCLISALIFGIPHFFGVPGGVLGSLMAGFLGWLLAKSVVETEGVFWAWFIHFLQDVLIFTGLFLAAL